MKFALSVRMSYSDAQLHATLEDLKELCHDTEALEDEDALGLALAILLALWVTTLSATPARRI